MDGNSIALMLCKTHKQDLLEDQVYMTRHIVSKQLNLEKLANQPSQLAPFLALELLLCTDGWMLIQNFERQ